MKYQWLDNKTCRELSAELGCEVKSISQGDIVVGLVDGRPVTTPGIEIEFAKEPAAEQLAKLDGLFPHLHRAGAMTATDELTALKDRIKQVEDQLKESPG